MENCIFCRIARGEISTRTVYSDETVIAFDDIDPVAPIHVLVIPREHRVAITDLAERPDIISAVFRAIHAIARDRGIDGSGFRLVANQGEDAGQTVPHVHFHITGGRKLGWPPG